MVENFAGGKTAFNLSNQGAQQKLPRLKPGGLRIEGTDRTEATKKSLKKNRPPKGQLRV